MRVEFRKEFRCTPWDVWPFLNDPEKQRLWLTSLLDFVPTSSIPRTVGSTFDLHMRRGRRVAHFEGRISGYDPPRHMGVMLWGGEWKPGVVIQADYWLADLGTTEQGPRTRLEYKAEIDIESLPFTAKLALPLARVYRFFRLRRFMNNLKRLSEDAAQSDSHRASPARPA